MMRRSLATLVLAACGSAAPAPLPPANTPTAPLPDATLPIAGAYRAPHTVPMVCDGGDDGWCEEEAADTMTITDAGGGRIDAAIELVQTNGHTCTFEGMLAPVPGSTTRWVFHSDDPDEGPCTLALERTPTEVTLMADGCRYYCGARASLDASFPVPPG